VKLNRAKFTNYWNLQKRNKLGSCHPLNVGYSHGEYKHQFLQMNNLFQLVLSKWTIFQSIHEFQQWIWQEFCTWCRNLHNRGRSQYSIMRIVKRGNAKWRSGGCWWRCRSSGGVRVCEGNMASSRVLDFLGLAFGLEFSGIPYHEVCKPEIAA